MSPGGKSLFWTLALGVCAGFAAFAEGPKTKVVALGLVLIGAALVHVAINAIEADTQLNAGWPVGGLAILVVFAAIYVVWTSGPDEEPAFDPSPPTAADLPTPSATMTVTVTSSPTADPSDTASLDAPSPTNPSGISLSASIGEDWRLGFNKAEACYGAETTSTCLVVDVFVQLDGEDLTSEGDDGCHLRFQLFRGWQKPKSVRTGRADEASCIGDYEGIPLPGANNVALPPGEYLLRIEAELDSGEVGTGDYQFRLLPRS